MTNANAIVSRGTKWIFKNLVEYMCAYMHAYIPLTVELAHDNAPMLLSQLTKNSRKEKVLHVPAPVDPVLKALDANVNRVQSSEHTPSTEWQPACVASKKARELYSLDYSDDPECKGMYTLTCYMSLCLHRPFVDPDFEEADSKISFDEDDDSEDSDMNHNSKQKRKTGEQPSKKKVKIGCDDVTSLCYDWTRTYP
jgi:hypothetical protein